MANFGHVKIMHAGGPVLFRTALPCTSGYYLERGGVPLYDVVGINCE